MAFAAKLIAWQRRHGRRHLPWQGTRDPYRIWLSEVMLQQTQVAAVLPYYDRFLGRFPTVRALAAAPQEEVLALWSGLGYYARARNLHAAAKIIARTGFPRSAAALDALPGIGRSTAAAIAAFAFGERAAILDGNVKRVLARAFGIDGWPGEPAVQARLWSLAESLLPAEDIEAYTQGLMDLGASVCAPRPRCGECPVRASCSAHATHRTGAIPAPRPRKPLPLRTATWHVVRCGREVYLEKRPDGGVWGGLLAFPERRPAGLRARAWPLKPFEHGFTHFRLAVRPLVYEVSRRTRASGWMPIDAALGGPVPAPVRRVLKALTEEAVPGARDAPSRRRFRAAPA